MKQKFNERWFLVVLCILAGIFAVWLICFSSVSKNSKTTEVEDEPKSETESESKSETSEPDVSWIFGEENGFTGLIPLSCTRIKGVYTYTFYDPETGVMYYLVRDENNAATASDSGVLVNPDGTPRIYAPKKGSGN